MSAAPGHGDTTTQVVARAIGNPLPLGFVGLAAATLLVSGLQLSWFSPTEGREVALILIAFVFPVQLVASVLGFTGRDVVAGTGMGILAGTWLSVGLVKLTGEPGSVSDPLGLLLLVSGTAMLVPAAGALGTKPLPAAVLTTTALRFAATGLVTGGPYSVAATANGFEGQTVEGIQTTLQGNTGLTFALSAGGGEMPSFLHTMTSSPSACSMPGIL